MAEKHFFAKMGYRKLKVLKNCKLRKMTRLTWVTRQTRQIFPPDRIREGWCENCQTCKIANLQFQWARQWVTYIISARDAGASENVSHAFNPFPKIPLDPVGPSVYLPDQPTQSWGAIQILFWRSVYFWTINYVPVVIKWIILKLSSWKVRNFHPKKENIPLEKIPKSALVCCLGASPE